MNVTRNPPAVKCKTVSPSSLCGGSFVLLKASPHQFSSWSASQGHLSTFSLCFKHLRLMFFLFFFQPYSNPLLKSKSSDYLLFLFFYFQRHILIRTRNHTSVSMRASPLQNQGSWLKFMYLLNCYLTKGVCQKQCYAYKSTVQQHFVWLFSFQMFRISYPSDHNQTVMSKQGF